MSHFGPNVSSVHARTRGKRKRDESHLTQLSSALDENKEEEEQEEKNHEKEEEESGADVDSPGVCAKATNKKVRLQRVALEEEERTRRRKKAKKGKEKEESDESEVTDDSTESIHEKLATKAKELLTEMKGDQNLKNGNYTIALLTNGTLLVTKVGGVTENAFDARRVREMAKKKGFRQIEFVQKKFGESSQHAEMIILNHVGKDKLGDITFLQCVAANCSFCYATLSHYQRGIAAWTTKGKPNKQQGWTHPFYTLNYGSHKGSSEEQLRELEEVHELEKGMNGNSSAEVCAKMSTIVKLGFLSSEYKEVTEW